MSTDPPCPPAKQANKDLMMRAISEAQVSINKTTAFPAVRQTVPMAPRTRSASDEMKASIELVQEHLRGLAPRGQTYPPLRVSDPQAARMPVGGVERVVSYMGDTWARCLPG